MRLLENEATGYPLTACILQIALMAAHNCTLVGCLGAVCPEREPGSFCSLLENSPLHIAATITFAYDIQGAQSPAFGERAWYTVDCIKCDATKSFQ